MKERLVREDLSGLSIIANGDRGKIRAVEFFREVRRACRDRMHVRAGAPLLEVQSGSGANERNALGRGVGVLEKGVLMFRSSCPPRFYTDNQN